MQSDTLNKFKLQKYYQNNQSFNEFYSTDNLLKINNWAFAINFDKYSDIGNN